jgi:hypothetical protein
VAGFLFSVLIHLVDFTAPPSLAVEHNPGIGLQSPDSEEFLLQVSSLPSSETAMSVPADASEAANKAAILSDVPPFSEYVEVIHLPERPD